jgi:RNA polymerase sigma factor (sigma-70 family)
VFGHERHRGQWNGSVRSDTTTLFVEHRAALVEYAARIVGSRAQAEDVVQEAWLRFDNAASGRFLDDPLSYLYRIVRNIALDGCRKVARERRHVVGRLDRTIEERPSAQPSPEAHSLHREQLWLVREALAELPERTRIALRLYRLEGSTLKDVAAHLGISIGLAHKLVAEGVRHCQKRLHRRN